MKVWLPILGLSVLMSSAFADQAGQATVSDAWVRAMPPGAGMTAAFLTVHNTGEQQISIVGPPAPMPAASSCMVMSTRAV